MSIVFKNTGTTSIYTSGTTLSLHDARPIAAPYVFASTGKLGVTDAVQLHRPDGGPWAVLGIDLTIAALSRILFEREAGLTGSSGLVFATDKIGRAHV